MLQCSKLEAVMRTHTKAHEDHSPLSLLTELAVEGTSNLVEAQRTLLHLAKQENEIILNGVKERVGISAPAVAAADLVRRGVDTLIGMQEELLTTTSKQTLDWLESEKAGKGGRTARLVEFAREGVETFTKAQKNFLEVVAQETAKATRGKVEHEGKAVKKTEIMHLAREAGNAFIEAQKRLLDVIGQQLNVNLDVATRGLERMSPGQFLPMATATGEGVRKFVNAETSLIGSLIKPQKKGAGRAKTTKGRVIRKAVAAEV
jgi:molybdenum-dependent DNA-binding transcriptional regulator ModE